MRMPGKLHLTDASNWLPGHLRQRAHQSDALQRNSNHNKESCSKIHPQGTHCNAVKGTSVKKNKCWKEFRIDRTGKTLKENVLCVRHLYHLVCLDSKESDAVKI